MKKEKIGKTPDRKSSLNNKSLTDLPNYKIRQTLQNQFDLSHTVSDDVLLETIKSYLK